MCPVYEPAEVVPFVHSADLDAVSQPNRDALCQIDVMRDQQRLAIAHVDDKALVAGAVIVVRQQSRNDTSEVDPRSRVTFVEALAHTVPIFIVVVAEGAVHYRVP